MLRYMIPGHLIVFWRLPLALVIVFLIIQFQAIDYGTTVNDSPYFRDSPVSNTVITGSALERNTMAGAGAGESPDRWIMRFKLYSIEADEHISVMALARMKPDRFRFDTHFYQYGGAWLYPLGAWYLLLSKLGVVSVAPLATYLDAPDLMDAVYTGGRAFVLFSVAGAALFLYAACRRFAPTVESALCMVLFLAAPGTVMFSQVMKPHWYALLWVCCSLLILTRCTTRHLPWRTRDTWILGVCLGMAVGSVLTLGLFAVLCWFVLVMFYMRSRLPFSTLFAVPAISAGIYASTNMFVFFNREAAATETSIVKDWFSPDLSAYEYGLRSITAFIENSLLPGFGTVTVLLIFAVACYHGASNPKRPLVWFVVGGIGILVLIALLTADIQSWHTNTRYLAYLLPCGILLLCLESWPGRKIILSLATLMVCLQSAPLALAYRDENSAEYGTRILASRWIADNIGHGAPLCLDTETPAPFEVPPIRFSDYRVNDPACSYTVVIEPRPNSPNGFENLDLVKRFGARYTSDLFPLVFSHINPQISIYRYD